MDPMINMAALAGIEKIINAALAYDPATRIALSSLTPKVLAIHITSPMITLYIIPQDDCLRIAEHYEGEITTHLSGNVSALLLLATSNNINLKDSGVQVMGNTHFLGELQHILHKLDLDWEELLTQLLGDILGHQSAELIRSKLNWTKDRSTNAMRLASEFLTQELNVLPSKNEVTFLNRQIDDIRLDVDRLEARLEHIFRCTENI